MADELRNGYTAVRAGVEAVLRERVRAIEVVLDTFGGSLPAWLADLVERRMAECEGAARWLAPDDGDFEIESED